MRFDELQEDDNAERWMVSYADFITLLFAFFVVMYAISSVNEDKYKVLSSTLAQAFDLPPLTPDAIQAGEPTLSASPHVVDLPDSTHFADHHYGDTFIEDPLEAAESLLGGFVDAQGASIHTDHEWVELRMASSVLFQPGQAQLNANAGTLLDETLTLLRGNDYPVTIEGYTDNVPSQSAQFPSNWELSAARASAIARFLVAQGVRPERIAAIGYGENHPLETNATPEGRAQNRRVSMVIARRSDASRNLNAQAPVKTFVRQEQAPTLDGVKQERTDEGGLRFTNEE